MTQEEEDEILADPNADDDEEEIATTAGDLYDPDLFANDTEFDILDGDEEEDMEDSPTPTR